MRHSKPLDLKSISHLAPELAAAIAAIASDIALVVDSDGIVTTVAIGRDSVDEGASAWVGKPWADTATLDTRKKIQMLLDEASVTGVSQRREINHVLNSGASVPMTYSAIRLGAQGPVLLAGRDLRAIAAIQQRFLDSQLEMERTYWSQRQASALYRMLFQVATDAVLVVDPERLCIVDANPSAAQVLGIGREQLIGSDPFASLEPNSRRASKDMLITARATAKAAECRARLSASRAVLTVSATPFRGTSDMLLLVRFTALDESHRSTDQDAQISGQVQSMSEAVVIADSGGRMLMANPAFLQLCGLGAEVQLKGVAVNDWLYGAETELAAMLSQVRHRGMSPTVPAFIKTLSGRSVPVELFASLLTDGEQDHIGINIRARVLEQTMIGNAVVELSATLETLLHNVGAAPLGELMERLKQAGAKHFAAIAVQQAKGDHKLAATMLGLSINDLQQCLASPEAHQAVRRSGPGSLH